MLLVGLTGNIGSGKSTVALIFEKLGVPVYYADSEARNILKKDMVQKEILDLFGTKILNSKGVLDRKKIADIVFEDEIMLNKLNAIIHPIVRKGFIDWCKLQKTNYVIQEAAILFESGLFKFFDKNIAVYCPEEKRIERVMARDKVTEESVKKRIKNQYSDKEKNSLADFLVINDEKKLLIPQVVKIHNSLNETPRGEFH